VSAPAPLGGSRSGGVGGSTSGGGAAGGAVIGGAGRPDRRHRIAVSLDDTDKAIIAELQQDGRIAYADLAPRIGLSPAATRQRVQRLLDAGVVNVVGVTDPLALGYPAMAMLGIQVDGDVVRIADAVAEIEGVIYVVLSSGSFDLLVEVIMEDTGTLLGIINDRIKTIDGVRRVESFVYFGIHTHRFGWGVR
jgi:Lrp/AsnC family transcriptional regulator, regulator for asnA, asnC and gidA